METKIFEALKREYSPLGLGDVFLKGYAERLAAQGDITDENLAEKITAQKAILEIMQSSLDSRVSTAQKKWQEDATKAAAEAERKRQEMQQQHDALLAKQKEDYEKQIEDLKKKTNKEPKNKTDMTREEIIEQYEAEQAAKRKEKEAQEKSWREQQEQYEAERKKEREQYEAERKAEREQYEKAQNERFEQMMEQMKKMNESNTTLTTQLETLKAEKAEQEKAAAAAARQASIVAKAKELGIPEWRIEEGFNIAADATEEKYTETLNSIAAHIKTKMLPNNGNGAASIKLDDKDPDKDEISAIADSLFKKQAR